MKTEEIISKLIDLETDLREQILDIILCLNEGKKLKTKASK